MENSSISFIPNLPGCEQGKGGDGFPVRRCGCHRKPPLVEVEVCPLRRDDIVKAEPPYDEVPNSSSEATVHEEV